jgi:hypothetical protein
MTSSRDLGGMLNTGIKTLVTRCQKSINSAYLLALHICGMNLVFLWDGHPARPLYYRAGRMPTPQPSSLDSATPIF